MRYSDFLRTSVLLFGASATVLGAVTLVGAHELADTTLPYFAVGLWALAATIGGWLGRRNDVSGEIGTLLANARTTPLLPELHPGTILVSRLWGLALYTVAAGAVAFVVPQVPAIAAVFPLIFSLYWRRQSSAVTAIEGRDGVRFYVEQTPPFKPTQLLRTPGFRKNEPAPTDAHGIPVP